MKQSTRHLDLGCGLVPRNPYKRDELFGVDFSADAVDAAMKIKSANLAIEPIPFESEYFDSVSAYDFLEHIPRIMPTKDFSGTRFPFIELMDEVHRVLKPRGLFYASTPCYPAAQAFGDPTHVNYFTGSTHLYFTDHVIPLPKYGFRGAFEVVRVELTEPGLVYAEPNSGPLLRIVHRIKSRLKINNSRRSHILWELRCVK